MTRSDYLALPHAVLRLGGDICSIIEARWHELDIAPSVAATAQSFAAMIFMVVDSPRLVATVQRRLAAQLARMLPIRVVECPIDIEPLRANMNWHASRDGDAAHVYLRSVFDAAGEYPKNNC